MRRFAVRALICVLLALPFGSVPALAFQEGGSTLVIPQEVIDANTTCEYCHREEWPYFDTRQGPHGNYSTSTDKCEICHTVHVAPSSRKLLPAVTITDTCYTCHDGTSGRGVYGALARWGIPVGATHRIDATDVIPGGDAATGGEATPTVPFTGVNQTLGCGDCHTPHDAQSVTPFRGERIRFHSDELTYGAPTKNWRTSHLLRQQPTGAPAPVTDYGSDWCAGCHAGRPSGGAVHNHPVDSSDTQATPYTYDNLPIVENDTSLVTVMGNMGLLGATTPGLIWHNRGFVMPSPRTPLQSGHFPICQQCHEDARNVGEPGAVNPAGVYRYGDGRQDESGGGTIDIPRFQTFPHEGVNQAFLVETYDTLCLNCHPASGLP